MNRMLDSLELAEGDADSGDAQPLLLVLVNSTEATRPKAFVSILTQTLCFGLLKK